MEPIFIYPAVSMWALVLGLIVKFLSPPNLRDLLMSLVCLGVGFTTAMVLLGTKATWPTVGLGMFMIVGWLGVAVWLLLRHHRTYPAPPTTPPVTPAPGRTP